MKLSKRFVFISANLLLLIPATILLTLIVYIFLNIRTEHNQYITVPDLSTLSLEQAFEILEEQELTYVINDSSNYDPNLPKFSVVSHTPSVGEEVKRGRKIYLTINPRNYRLNKIPAFKNKTLREVVAVLRTQNFYVKQLEYVPLKGKNVVVGLKKDGNLIPEGIMLPIKTELTLVVAEGVGGMTRIPNIQGMRLDKAIDILLSSALNYRIRNPRKNGVVLDRSVSVRDQTPSPNVMTQLGETISIWVK